MRLVSKFRMAELDEINRGTKRKMVVRDNNINTNNDNTTNVESNTLVNKKSLKDRLCMYSTQLPDSDEEYPYYETKGLVTELISDTNTNEREKGESHKAQTELTVAQKCEQLDSGAMLEMAIAAEEAEGPIAYSQKHAEPSEVEDRGTRTPLIDVELAQAKMNQAILTYEDNVCVQDEALSTDFKMETMSILNPKFSSIPKDVQTVLFHILGDTVENMILALSAGIQFGLINKTLAKGVFWPEVANSMGIVEPAFITKEFGTRSPMKIHDDKRRNKTADELQALVHQFKESVNTIILSRALRETTSTLLYCLDQYKHRFDETLDDKDWSDFINFDLITSLQSKGATASHILRECHNQLNEYRNLFDELSDYCVVWARPQAIYNCRVQLRALFDGHSQSSYITLLIPRWNSSIRIQHSEVPPIHDTATSTITKSDKHSAVSNKKPRENKPPQPQHRTSISKLELYKPVPKILQRKKPR